MPNYLSDIRGHINEVEGLLSSMCEEVQAVNSQAAKAKPVAEEVSKQEKRVSELKEQESQLSARVKELRSELDSLRARFQ